MTLMQYGVCRDSLWIFRWNSVSTRKYVILLCNWEKIRISLMVVGMIGVCVVVRGGVLVQIILLLMICDSGRMVLCQGLGRRDGNRVGLRGVARGGGSRVYKVILEACTAKAGHCGITTRKLWRLLFFRWSMKAPEIFAITHTTHIILGN